MEFFTTVKIKDNYFLNYSERIFTEGENVKTILDFDGFVNRIESKDYLQVCDDLHEIIIAEFEKTIRGPVYEMMKKDKKDE